MKRSLAAPILGMFSVAALCGIVATRAPAQVTAPWPSSFPAATPSPTEALTGTITASQPFQAQMQTSNGTLTLKLHAGTVILNPNLLGWSGPFQLARFEGVAPGQRVYVLGFAQSDGTLRADEIDIMPPLQTTSTLPTPAPTQQPS